LCAWRVAAGSDIKWEQRADATQAIVRQALARRSISRIIANLVRTQGPTNGLAVYLSLLNAAEAGRTGDPNDYRDFWLPEPPMFAQHVTESECRRGG